MAAKYQQFDNEKYLDRKVELKICPETGGYCYALHECEDCECFILGECIGCEGKGD